MNEDLWRKLFPAVTHSVEETYRLGELVSEAAGEGDVIALCGDLGSGKTHLVKGIARGLGVDPREVVSPTFVFLRSYEGKEGKPPLIHLDAYRLEDPEEIARLGWEDEQALAGIRVVEWPEKVREILPAQTLWVDISPVSSHQRRFVWLENGGPPENRVDPF